MGLIDALWHLANLLLPALGMALWLPTLVKLVWFRRVDGALWARLVGRVALSGALVVVAFWAVLGRDGTMALYAALVAVSAAVVWWSAFRGRV